MTMSFQFRVCLTLFVLIGATALWAQTTSSSTSTNVLHFSSAQSRPYMEVFCGRPCTHPPSKVLFHHMPADSALCVIEKSGAEVCVEYRFFESWMLR